MTPYAAFFLAAGSLATADLPRKPQQDFATRTEDICGVWDVVELGPDGRVVKRIATWVIDARTITVYANQRHTVWQYQLGKGKAKSREIDLTLPGVSEWKGIYRRATRRRSG